MLKSYKNHAYIFAMINGAASSNPGERTFTLPAALSAAKDVEVLNENRVISVKNGKFTDDFSHEYTYHIYRVAIGLTSYGDVYSVPGRYRYADPRIVEPGVDGGNRI